ncbi:LacI family DNA-binding transcriptional regulator [Ruania rhizosphaerae]|uniref:LacI family DNA-binding transcriptional regulator n=1 Tax=Ruania rhizosphaerae TaxID=1840413 RepID=UPI00135A8C2F|nr:LacI family DNA-binding transcriptional regulator [Ruania rhizosphaerae]
MTQARRPTSRDVAAAAEVSVATVSYVMNGRTDRRIPEVTRDRVLAAAEELGYAPDRAARMLRRRSTEQICLVIGSFGVPVLDQLAASLHETGDRHGFGLITMVVNSPPSARRAIERLRERIADGVVIAGGLHHIGADGLQELARAGMPAVVLSNAMPADGFDVYCEPESEAMAEAVGHLWSSDRRRIAYLGHEREVAQYHAGLQVDSDRFAAFATALEGHGGRLDADLVVAGADSRAEGYRAVSALLSAPRPPDAIVAASSRSAVSTIWAARDQGLNAPHDLAVVGAGAIPEALVIRPTLSTIGPPGDSDFTDLATMLFDRITARDAGRWREIRRPWIYHRRGST